MRLRYRNQARHGFTVLEFVLIITAFLMLVLGTIDLAMAVFRYHVLSQAARQGVRQVIIHGELADAAPRNAWETTLPHTPTTYVPYKGGAWGPASPTSTANPGTYPGSPDWTGSNPYTLTFTPSDSNSKSSDYIANAIRPYLAGIPGDVTVTVQWMNGNNNVERGVQVTLSTTWQPTMLFLFGNTINLRASSRMPIAH